MKELWRKKGVKAVLAVIVILAAVVIASINAQSAQKRRNYNLHVDAAEKYLMELEYEQAIVEYTLALEIEPNAEEILEALEETYVAYAQTFVDNEEYESAIQVLQRGYAQTAGERLQVKIEELTDLQVQKEEEARLLAEEAEKRCLLEEEEKKKQKQQAEMAAVREEEKEPEEIREEEEAEEEASDDAEQEETIQIAGEEDKAAYQTKAAEYIFSMQKDYYEKSGGYPFVDARKLKTQAEFYEYYNNGNIPKSELGICVGAVNTALLEETETQCRIKVTDMLYNSSQMETGWILYFEFIIDKTTEQGTLVEFYDDYVYILDIEGGSLRGTVINHDNVDSYSDWKGMVFDFSK